SPLTFKLGMIHTPWLDWEEALWDYRMQGQMALERGGYMTSSDIGFGGDGKWGPDKVNMQVTFVNGEGYSGGPGDQAQALPGALATSARQSRGASPSACSIRTIRPGSAVCG